MREESKRDLLEQRPALAAALVVALGVVGYAAVTLALDGQVRPAETGLFAVAFAAVYLGFAAVQKRVL